MVSDTVREQHFYVAIAKHLYLDAGHGLVSVREAVPVAQAAEHGLEPLVLYGLTAAGLPVRWMCFSRLDMPLDLGEVLASGWAQARSLGGVPDVLKVSRGLAAACPGLEQGLRSVGVRLVVADTREKSLPASMRAAQVEARNLVDFRGPVASIEGLSRRVAEACSEGASDWRINCERIAVREPMRQLRDEPFRDLATKIGCRLNWEQGAWLRSWEASLGPRREQVLYGVRGGGASLVPAGNAAEYLLTIHCLVT